MKCLSCSRSANFQIPNNPKIVFCDKICHFDYVNGKREREEEQKTFNMDNVLLKEFLLRVDPLTLINSELVNKKYNTMIFTQLFMEQYVKLHEIPDEFMWWIYTKTRPANTNLKNARQFEKIVKSHYNGFFNDLFLSSDMYLIRACNMDRMDIIDIIFKYNTKISKIGIQRCLEASCKTLNVVLFDFLFEKIEMDTEIADLLLYILSLNFNLVEQVPSVKKIFFKLYRYCSDDSLPKTVPIFIGVYDILEAIFKRIKVTDDILAEVIDNTESKENQITYMKRILELGVPESFELTKESLKFSFNEPGIDYLVKNY